MGWQTPISYPTSQPCFHYPGSKPTRTIYRAGPGPSWCSMLVQIYPGAREQGYWTNLTSSPTFILSPASLPLRNLSVKVSIPDPLAWRPHLWPLGSKGQITPNDLSYFAIAIRSIPAAQGPNRIGLQVIKFMTILYCFCCLTSKHWVKELIKSYSTKKIHLGLRDSHSFHL